LICKHLRYVCLAAGAAVLLAQSPQDQKLTAEGEIAALDWRAHAPTVTLSSEDGSLRSEWRIASPGAGAIRLHFVDFGLPPGAQLWLRNAGGDFRRGPYTRSGPLEEGTFWSLPVPGEEVVVELILPQGSLAGTPFRIAELGRLAADAGREWQDAPSRERGEMRAGWFRGRIVEFEVRDGEAVFEGDMLLGPADEIPPPPSSKDGTREGVAIDGTAHRWPGGRVAYTIDPRLPNPQRVLDAVAHWNQQLSGYITIVPRTSEAAYLTFVPSSGCSSYVGFRNVAAQAVNLADGCSTGNTIHEIGHALGLYHEHTREDRNNYVRVLTENIDPTKTSNFTQQITNASDIGTYDYNSIMHYPAYAFSINGLPTIETIPAGIAIGQRSGLSSGDISATRAIYGGSAPAPSTVTVTLNSNPGGLTLYADGAAFSASRSFSWTPGTVHTLSAPDQSATGTQYLFSSWSNGGAQTQSYATPSSNASVTANYAVRHQVRAVTGSGSGTVTQSPASADFYYAANTNITITATAAPGSCLVSWTGVAAAANPVINVVANQPYSIAANFQAGAVGLSPAALSFSSAAGSQSVSVSGTSGCAWTAQSGTSWLTVSPATGSGSGVLTVTVDRNRGRSARTGTVSVGGVVLAVTQAGR
jgi:hypothetical protein